MSSKERKIIFYRNFFPFPNILWNQYNLSKFHLLCMLLVSRHLLDGNIVLQGAIETELAEIGIDKVLKYALTSVPAAPFYLPKGKALREQIDIPITLPSWLSEDELKYYVTQYEKTGFTGGLNYYRNFDLYVSFNLVFIGNQNLHV